MSSKRLALSSSPLAMRRMVYTAPGLSPSITWKLWEVFTAAEILQLPSPWSAQTAKTEQFTPSKRHTGRRSTGNLYNISTNQWQFQNCNEQQPLSRNNSVNLGGNNMIWPLIWSTICPELNRSNVTNRRGWFQGSRPPSVSCSEQFWCCSWLMRFCCHRDSLFQKYSI